MPARKHDTQTPLPRRFDELVRLMPPRAIASDAQHRDSIEMVDRLMASGKLSKDQESYLETLVQLVQVYEASEYSIELPSGIDALRHLLEQHDINASGLARLLGVHPSMGSKILKGERSLTVDHIMLLAAKFNVRPDTFMDGSMIRAA